MCHVRKQEITFFIHAGCNLKCQYCYMPFMKVAAEDKVIDLNFAAAGLRDFFSDNRNRTIRFFAPGEPTLAFDEMREVYNVAVRLVGKRDLKVELQTNGYFDDSIAQWVENHVDILWISCDGPPRIQDKQRPSRDGRSSSGVVLANVERFASHPFMQFGVRATVERENHDNQIDLLRFFKKNEG